jgi:superfamily II DNA/RNA helicase
MRLVINDANYEDPEAPMDSSKMDELMHIIEESGEEQILLFTYFHITLSKMIKTISKKNIKYMQISSDMSKKERDERLEKFKKDKSYKILLTTDILAYGLDMGEVSIIVHFDLPLKMGVFRQRIGRLTRIDSENPFITNIILYTDNEFDKHVRDILLKKTAYAMFLKGKTEIDDSNIFTKEELEKIMKKIK